MNTKNDAKCDTCDTFVENNDWWIVTFPDEKDGPIRFYTCKVCAMAAQKLEIKLEDIE